MTSNGDVVRPREYLFKVVLIGDVGTGKTSIVERVVKRTFTGRNLATIGVDFAVKMIDRDPATKIKLQLWDISGRERFVDMTRIYYKEAVGALLIYDLTSESSADTVIKWKEDLDRKATLPIDQPIPCILLANKCDLPQTKWKSDESKLEELGKACKCLSWYKASAKKDFNIAEALEELITKMLENNKEIEAVLDREDKIFLTDPIDSLKAETGSGGCC